jgi:hypothetical protein
MAPPRSCFGRKLRSSVSPRETRFTGYSMNEASIEELKQLLSLVRCGRLFDVQAWLANRKPFRTTAQTRVNPILESVQVGFHSVVEVFLSAGLKSQALTELLAEAVGIHREDLVRLLIDHGVDVRSVPFEDTLYEWHPGIVGLFLKHGADFVTGSPFAGAFICKRRTVLGIFKGLLEKDPFVHSSLGT